MFPNNFITSLTELLLIKAVLNNKSIHLNIKCDHVTCICPTVMKISLDIYFDIIYFRQPIPSVKRQHQTRLRT